MRTKVWIAGKRVSQGILSSDLIAAAHCSAVTLFFANEHSCISSSVLALLRGHEK
jgi:hypothetical protein